MAVASNWKTLFDAVERNDTKAVKRTVEDGLAASTNNPTGDTAAHLAARKGNFEIFKYLASKDKSVLSKKNAANQTVLHLAVVKGSLDIVKYLVDDCHIDTLHEDNVCLGNNAIHTAAREGHIELLKYFIEEKKIDVNVLNDEGEPPAFLAASNKKLPVIKFLLEEHNADVMIVNYENQNILYPAARVGDVTVPTYLLDEKKIELEVDWRDKWGRTVLHWSSLHNYLKISEYFVNQKKSDVNMFDLMKQTPLHLAAEAGHIKLVEFLYQAGADPELEDAHGKTPPQLATQKKIIQFFTEFPKMKIRERRSAPTMTISEDRSSVREPKSYVWAQHIATYLLSSQGFIASGHTNLKKVDSINVFEGFLTLANAYIGYNERPSNRTPLSTSESIRNRMDSIATDVIQSLS